MLPRRDLFCAGPGRGSPTEQGPMFEQGLRDRHGSGESGPSKQPYGESDSLTSRDTLHRNIEVKDIQVWAKSIYNTNYAADKPWNKYDSMVQQLQRYSHNGGVDFYTNSPDLANTISQENVPNIRVFIAPANVQ